MKSEYTKLKIVLIFVFWVMLLYPDLALAEEKLLCPIGKTVGITAMYKGLCVVSVTEFETVNGEVLSPAGKAGINAEDIIIGINGKDINSVEELEDVTDKSNGNEMKIEILRKNEKKEIVVIPQKTKSDEKYKIGLWIKDSTSGIGTLTYYDPSTKTFGALGHGICDEYNNLIDMNTGYIHDANVNSVRRGEKGIPGELIAVFEDDENKQGKINLNSGCGVFGVLDEADYSVGEAVPVADRESVCEGEVSILSNIEGDKVSEYSAEIVKINDDEANSRCMIIKITDQNLLEKTGGIVRGMSGSPIIQDGKLVGAVTHVFVNDPTRGYGIFIENMLSEAEKIE